MRFRCPECKRDVSLWRGVELAGWQSIDRDGNVIRTGSPDRDVYWEQAIPDGDFGCGECGWEGRELERVGWDGEPLPEPNPNQMTWVDQ